MSHIVEKTIAKRKESNRREKREKTTHEMVHAPLNRMAQRQRLPLARHHNHDLPTIQHRRDADRQRHMQHLADIALEEPRVRQNGVVCEGLDPRAARERGAGLVERDVPVLADAPEEELDAAVRLDLGLVRFAFSDEVLCVAVEDVHLRGRDVDCQRRWAVRRVVCGWKDVLCEKSSRNMKVW